MASISQAKSLGAVGSILVLLTVVPSAGALFGIVGFILILVAIKSISDLVADRSIFRNMLIAVGLSIAGIAAGTVVLVGSFFRFMGIHNLTFADLGTNFDASAIPVGDWLGLVGSIVAGLVIVWALLLVSAIFVRRSYGAMASKLSVSMFGTAGLLYLIGAATTIILVGFVILFVAQVLLTVAFFSIDETKIGATVTAAPPAPPAPSQTPTSP